MQPFAAMNPEHAATSTDATCEYTPRMFPIKGFLALLDIASPSDITLRRRKMSHMCDINYVRVLIPGALLSITPKKCG
jgi:hypothetical protein